MADSAAPGGALELCDALPIAVFVTCVAGSRVLLANRKCLDLFELPDADKDELALVDVWGSLEQRMEVMELLEDGPVRGQKVDFVSRGGRRFSVRLSVTETKYDGEEARVWSFDEGGGDGAILATDEALRQLVAITPSATLVERESDGAIQLVNRSAATLFGRLESQLVGTSAALLFAEEDERSRLIGELGKSDAVDGVEVSLRTNSEVTFMALVTSRLANYRGEAVVVSSITVPSEDAGAESTRHQLAIRDVITGLYNRSYFSRVARHEFERARRYGRTLCVGVIELGAEGETLADELLQALADICLDCVRENDVLARYTANELVVLLPETEIAGAKVVMQRMRFEVQHAGFSNDVKGLESRAGVSEVLTEDDSVNDVIRRAKQALVDSHDSGNDAVLVL